MKVRCLDNKIALLPDETGEFRFVRVEEPSLDLVLGKDYEVLAEEHGMYRIKDESGEAYLYPIELFEALVSACP